MYSKRIVSFLPSATELIFELGAQDQLVGVTHECTYPEQAKTKLRVINSVFESDVMTSSQIDNKITELARNGQPIFVVLEENMKKADPDLIISQGTCAVCSAYTNEINRALEILVKRPQIEVLDPHNLDDIISGVMIIASKIGKMSEGLELIKSLKKRIDHIKEKRFQTQPRILCIEWIEPFFTSGHWIPQMVEIAGGINLFSTLGEHSRKMTMDEIVNADPDIIIMMPCGFDVNRTSMECTKTLQSNVKWKNICAVKNRNLYAVDANSYFSKPSIRTITGIEILAKIIHPEECSDLCVPDNSFRKLDH